LFQSDSFSDSAIVLLSYCDALTDRWQQIAG